MNNTDFAEFKAHLIHRKQVSLLNYTVLNLCDEGAELVAMDCKTHFNMVIFEMNERREECLNWDIIHVTLPLATNTIPAYRIFLPSHFLRHFRVLFL